MSEGWAKIEGWFLTVTRIMIFVIMGAAAVYLIVVGTEAISDYMAEPNVTRSIQTPNFSEFRVIKEKEFNQSVKEKEERQRRKKEEELRKKNNENGAETENQKTPVKQKSQIQIKFENHKNEILKNLRIYAAELGESAIDEKRLGLYLVNQANKILKKNESLAFDMLLGLSRMVIGLRENAKEIEKFNVADPRRVNSREIVVWYVKEFEDRHLQEGKRITQEKREVRIRNLSVLAKLPFLGGALGAFMVALLFVIIFRIESNTRKSANKLSD
jgi:hypothetical protein